MALRIAKKLIVYIRRDGGQSQYSPYLATDLPLKTVAFRCGFHNSKQMRVIYARRLDTTPREYRERFRQQQLGPALDDEIALPAGAAAKGIRIGREGQGARPQ